MRPIILNLEPGTEAWHSERMVSFCASEAPVMMGDAPWETRDALLLRKKTGIVKGVSYFTQKVFDKGHRVEAAARPIAEQFIGDDLHQNVFVRMVDGMRMLASLDGITMPLLDIIWECKQYNKELFEIVSSGGELEGKHFWQLEHQMLVVGDCQCIFAVSNGTPDCYAQMVYVSRPERRAKLIAHWRQFAIDLENYVLPAETAPKAIAEPVATLPSITYNIDLTKGISITSNLAPFKAAAQMLVEQSLTELVTDQDFANAGARVKACKKAEENIDSLIDRVLGDLGDVNVFKGDLESIKSWIRESRLNQEKKITNRNAARRTEIVLDGQTALEAHIKAINAKLAPIVLPKVAADFAGAIKGRSNFDNMIAAVNDKLAAAKIEADALFVKFNANINLINDIAAEHLFLFADLQQLCNYELEPLRAVALQRIADHKAEQTRIAAAAEEKRLAEVKRVEDARLAAIETKRIADEAAEILLAQTKSTSEALAPLVNQAINELPLISVPESAADSIPHDEYDSMMSAAETETSAPKVYSGFGSRAPASIERPTYSVRNPTLFQQGFVEGLALAIKIFEHHGGKDFVKVVNEFIESDAIPDSKVA